MSATPGPTETPTPRLPEPEPTPAARRKRRTAPIGPIGYTGSYREFPDDLIQVSVVSALEARGPE